MQEIYVPATGMASDGIYLAQWLKQPGDQISEGDGLAEIETDKAELTLEAPGDGVLGRHRFAAGTTVDPGSTVSILLAPGESEPDSPTLIEPDDDTGTDSDTGPSDVGPETRTTPSGTNRTGTSAETATSEAMAAEATPLNHNDRRRDPVTAELEPYTLSPRRRKESRETAPPVPRPLADPTLQLTEGMEEDSSRDSAESHDRYRAAVASAVARSWKEIPHFAVNREIRVERLQEVMRSFKMLDSRLTFTDVLVKLFAVSLIERFSTSSIDIGLAVATPEGVAIPILTDVARHDLLSIATMRRSAVDRALAHRMNADDHRIPHSTVSNLGGFGVDSFTGIVPNGQTSILTVGAAAQRPVVIDGELAVAITMHLTLNVDHREWDGQQAAAVLQRCAGIASEPAVLAALS